MLKNTKNFLKFRNPLLMKKQLFKCFDLHEYQSKQIFRENGLNVQKGDLALTPEQAFEIGKTLKGELILKAQVHAGGRGKGKLTSGLQGGVKICSTSEQLRDYAKQMIGYNLITHQTSKDGLPVKSVLVLESVDIKRQIYLAIILDRTHQSPVLIISNEGGVDIEEVANSNPDAIKTYPIDINKGITKEILENVCKELNFEGNQVSQAKDQLQKLYSLFLNLDATQIEINPWAVDTQGDLYLVDAKVNIDDSAAFRQQRLVDMKNNSEASEDVDENEEKANKAGLNYIALDGNIGCLVNGAGLAMATMDIIKLKGGSPANFLDVGGGATVDQVTQAFEILTNHPKVKSILVNIFGGIMRCDIIAKGIVSAIEKVGVKVPIVVRLTGTNAEEGNKILNEFSKKGEGKVTIITANNLDEGADKVVKTLH